MSNDEGDDHVAHYACHEHRQKAHHGQDRVQTEIVLVVQLRIASRPSVPATRGTKREARAPADVPGPST